jgi:hypothetical protein
MEEAILPSKTLRSGEKPREPLSIEREKAPEAEERVRERTHHMRAGGQGVQRLWLLLSPCRVSAASGNTPSSCG